MRETADVMNAIIQRRGYAAYLEIGVAEGTTFNQVRCILKHGVDPDPRSVAATFRCTSDQFFAERPGLSWYDLVFVDGLHFFENALRDVNNALLMLRDGGTVVMHDVLPKTREQQSRDGIKQLGDGWYIPIYEWPADSWKALAILRATRPDLSIFTIDLGFGYGVIRKGRQQPWLPGQADMLAFEYFQANRDKLLNVVSIAEALELI